MAAPAGSGFRGYLRELKPELGRSGWLLQVGGLVNAIGSGLVFPFVIIYLHNVRGFALGTSGLVVGAFGLFTFLGTPVAGWFIDRVGARAALGVSLLLLAAGFGAFPLVRAPWHAVLCMAAAGAGNGGFWPSQTTLMIGLAEGAERTAAFALQRVGQNVGMAFGGVAGGVIAATSDPSTFTFLFVADAATFVAFAAVLAAVRLPGQTAEPEQAPVPPGRYRDVFQDRLFLSLIALNVVMVTAAYAQFEVVLPAFAKNDVGVTEKAVGAIFFVNMLGVAIAQLPVTRMLEGRPRMRALAVATVFWAATFIVVLATSLWLHAAAAAAALIVASVLFTAGEVLHGPAQSSLAADLAPPRLRGRYFSLVTNSYALGYTLGPPIGAIVLATSASALWLGATLVLALSGMILLGFEQRLPAALRAAPTRNGTVREPQVPMEAQRVELM